MGLEEFVLEAVLVDHNLEVDVYVLATGQVECFLLLFLLLQFLHLLPSLLSFDFELFDGVEGVALVTGRFHILNYKKFF